MTDVVKLSSMARDWQAIAIREATDLVGTPDEGAAKIAEAKRYGMLADALAMWDKAEAAEALLREAREWILDGYYAPEFMARIDAFLSTPTGKEQS